MIQCFLNSDPIACLWGLVPLWAQWGVFICIALIVAGIAWRLVVIAKNLGGWTSAVGALGLIGIAAAIFWPRKVETAQQKRVIWPDEDPQPEPAPRKKKRKTIFD